jgi:hypothetical protein
MIGAAGAAIVIPVGAPAVVTRLARASAPPAIHQRGKSGIWGTVGFGGPCGPGQPVKATQHARSQKDGHVETEFTSAQDGTFEVELPAGGYLIEQSLDEVRKAQHGNLQPEWVVVPENKFVEVSLWYDNGMRLPC